MFIVLLLIYRLPLKFYGRTQKSLVNSVFDSTSISNTLYYAVFLPLNFFTMSTRSSCLSFTIRDTNSVYPYCLRFLFRPDEARRSQTEDAVSVTRSLTEFSDLVCTNFPLDYSFYTLLSLVVHGTDFI